MIDAEGPGPFSDFLPPEVLTEDPDLWIAPSPQQLRSLIGLRSATRTSATAAAKLVGVSDRGFRMYLASDAGKASKISFAAWHLLLIKLCIKPEKWREKLSKTPEPL